MQKLINFNLETTGKKNVIVLEAYLEPSQTFRKVFWENS